MLNNTLSKNKEILSDQQLIDLGFKPEPIESMEQGTYQTHSITKGDSFIEVVNEFDENGKHTAQFMDVRITNSGLRNYTAKGIEELKWYMG